MRYIRKQLVTQTIYDGTLQEGESIITLIENLIKISVDIHFEYREEKTDSIKVHDRIRILSLDNNMIKIRVFANNATAIISNIPIQNIECIRVTTDRSLISIDEENVSVGEFIDFT